MNALNTQGGSGAPGPAGSTVAVSDSERRLLSRWTPPGIVALRLLELASGAHTQLRGRLPMLPPTVLSTPLDQLTMRRLARRMGLSVPERVVRTTADILVVRVDEGCSGIALALKNPLSERAAAALAREEKMLHALTADPRLDGEWRALLPQPLPLARARHRAAAVGPRVPTMQGWMPGVPASTLADRGPEVARRGALAALDSAVALQRLTGKPKAVTEALLDSWVGPALGVLRAEISWCRGPEGESYVAALENRLREGLIGRTVTVAWTHGDYHPGNVLLAPEKAERTTGVIDWVQARPDGPSAVDPCLYLLSLRHQLAEREFGACVVDAIANGGLAKEDRDLLSTAGLDLDAYGTDGAVLPLLTWLWHTTGNTAKSRRFARSHRWVARNVIQVLRAL